MPDFDAGEFFVEAKTGQWRFSVAPKKYQIDSFPTTGKPAVYCLGFHDFEFAGRRLAKKSNRKAREILKNKMNVRAAYFVSNEIIARMFDKESRLNQKGTIFYCALKRRNFEYLIANKQFSRDGKIVYPDNHYGIRRGQFIFSEPSASISSFPYGYMLSKKNDKPVIAFLEKKGIIQN